MCLLVVLHRVRPDLPVVVAANRDERLDRASEPVQVLRDAPRTLGGRDGEAGGTWLAVNEHGVVAALTNTPSGKGSPPGARSRGELPLLLTAHSRAEDGVQDFLQEVDTQPFGPCWMLVADRDDLWYLDLSRPEAPEAELLPSGVHVLENTPLEPASPKAEAVAARVEVLVRLPEPELFRGLEALLASHEPPESGDGRPPELESPCVHAPGYGTRSASRVVVYPGGPPGVWSSEDAPCRAPLVPVEGLWD